jgi:serine/threonine protein kinase
MVDYVGQQLGSYRILRLLGTGGFADVYLGQHVRLDTQAAIKVLHTRLVDKEMKSFLAEARTIASLDHSNIVHMLEFDVRDGVPFLVMTYAPNGTLRQSHPAGDRLALATILPYVKQLADALQYAHESKVIHRDVKPENMLVGLRNKIMLSDFGIATVTRTSRVDTEPGLAGTARYMAPEQIQDNPCYASDQYSLGIVVYEWLVGEPPFRGSFFAICDQQIRVDPPPLRTKNPEVSLDVERVVLTALKKDPLQRFPSVQAFADALEQASKSVQPIMPTCLRCGEPLLLNATFCGNCGYHFSTARETPSTLQVFKDEHTLPLGPRGGPVQRQMSSWPTINTSDSTMSALPTAVQPSPPPLLVSKKPSTKRNTLIISAIVLIVLILTGIGLYPYILKTFSPATADISCLSSTQNLLFGDCFLDNTNKWDTTSQPDQYSAKLSHNSLILEDDNNTWFSETIRGTPHIFTDFRLEVDANLSQGDPINSYGIVIRGAQDTNGRFKSYYRFELFGNGQYAINKSDMKLVDVTSASAIHPQGSINHITITAKGPILTLSVNNVMIKSINDGDYNAGYIALFISNNPSAAPTAQATFSKLGIYQE